MASARRLLAILVIALAGVPLLARVVASAPAAPKAAASASASVSASASASVSLDAGSDVAPEVAVDAAVDDAALAKLALEAEALDVLNAGQLHPVLTIDALFGIDITNDVVAQAKREEIAIAIALRGGADAGDDLLLRVLRGRLAFLSKPVAARKALVKAEADRAKLLAEAKAQAQAKAAAIEEEKEAAEARKRALAEASNATDERRRALLAERARAEGVRSEQAALRRKLGDRKDALAKLVREEGARVNELVERGRSVAPGSAAADALFDEVVLALDVEKARFQAALDAYVASEKVPTYQADPAVLAGVDPTLDAQREQLLSMQKTLGADAATLQQEWAHLDDEELQAAFHRDRALLSARLALIGKLTPDRRSAVLGLGEQGLRALGLEITHTRLIARWALVARRATLARFLAGLRDPFVLWGIAWRLAFGIGLIGFAASIARRGERWSSVLREIAAKLLRRPFLLRASTRALDVFEALFAELVWVTAVLLAPVLVTFPKGGAAATVHGVVFAFVVYRLILRAAHLLIARAASTSKSALSPELSDKILRSLKLVGRWVLAFFVLGTVAEAVLGRGYLYTAFVRIAVVGSLPIAGLLIRRWRDDIADAYLTRRATGPLADLVRNTRGRWYGFFVATVAVVFVIAGGVARAARGFVLGFEQSRKALAYLFRRRLEARADLAEAPPDPELLPKEVRLAFRDAAVREAADAIARFPEIDRFDAALAAWLEGNTVGAFLVAGRDGFGKSSWLAAAIARVGELPVVKIELEQRLRDRSSLYSHLSRALEVPDPEGDAEAFARALREGPRRLVAIDDLHLTFLRGVGAMEGWHAFRELIERVGDHVFWLATIDHHAYQYLEWARSWPSLFKDVVRLQPWSEQEVAALLRARMEAVGYRAVYDDLVVERLEGLERQAQIVGTEREYMRLIWDYADGSPRAALHYWLHSLTLGGGMRLRVRLFGRPDGTALEELDEIEKFTLAAVVWHGSLTADEAALALNYDRFACEAALRRLRDLGVLRVEQGAHVTTTAWWPAAMRYLRRKHLVSD